MGVPNRETMKSETQPAAWPTTRSASRLFAAMFTGAYALLVVDSYPSGDWIVMVLGAVLSLTKVSFAVAVEGRDRRRRVAAVDHRPPPTETGAPVARSSTSLLHPDPPEAGEQS